MRDFSIDLVWAKLQMAIAAVGGWLLLGQVLSAREMAGCAVMLAACVLAQLPEKRRVAVSR